ncbi:MAG: hypothetical protein H6R10_628 [Rhodocyclaceae bacterium]|nr:hypothetical protein [Rhodocyclaceae bacterium]
MEFSAEMVQQVWDKARANADQNPDTWRRDECGAWIRREHYGRQDSEFGWRIENVSVGGPNTVDNLRALNCANSYDRANGRAHCRLAADLSNIPAPERVFEPRNRPA